MRQDQLVARLEYKIIVSPAALHGASGDAEIFLPGCGGKHAYDPVVDERLVIIGTASFLNDVVDAVTSFLDSCKNDVNLRARVEKRLPGVLASFSIAERD